MSPTAARRSKRNVFSEHAPNRRTQTNPSECNPRSSKLEELCHFQVTPGGRPAADIAQDFVQAIEAIRGEFAPACEFLLVGAVERVDLDATTVTWFRGDGQQAAIPRDTQEGWIYDSEVTPTRVLIRGDTCTRILEDAAGHVEVRLTCPER